MKIFYFKAIVFINYLIKLSAAVDLDTLYNRILSDDPQYGYLRAGESFEYLKEIRSLEPQTGLLKPRMKCLEPEERSSSLSSSVKSNDISEDEKDCDPTGVRNIPKRLLQKSEETEDDKHRGRILNISNLKHVWRRILDIEVASMIEDEKLLVQNLTEEVEKIIPNRQSGYKQSLSSLSTKELSSGILPYFEASTQCRIDQFLVGSRHKRNFQDEYTRLVKVLCSHVEIMLGSSIELLELVPTDIKVELMENNDEFEQSWLNNIEVCREIYSRREPISIELYKLLKEKHCGSKSDGNCLPIIFTKMKQLRGSIKGCLRKIQ